MFAAQLMQDHVRGVRGAADHCGGHTRDRQRAGTVSGDGGAETLQSGAEFLWLMS